MRQRLLALCSSLRLRSPILRGLLSSRNHSLDAINQGFDEDDAGRTTITLLNRDVESGLLFINAFSQFSFTLNTGVKVVGPCAIFPTHLLQWNVNDARDINKESLSLFCVLNPKIAKYEIKDHAKHTLTVAKQNTYPPLSVKPDIRMLRPDILVIGAGTDCRDFDYRNLQFLRSQRISTEVLPTEEACALFNELNAERRIVAAALIPPAKVMQSNLDLAEPEEFAKGLWTYDKARQYDKVTDVPLWDLKEREEQQKMLKRRGLIDPLESDLNSPIHRRRR